MERETDEREASIIEFKVDMMRNMKRKVKTRKNFWKGKRVLVTGGSGFIGSHLSEMLVSRGAEVTVVGKEKKGEVGFLDFSEPHLQYHQADLSALAPRMVGLCRGKDVLFHLAARVAGIGFNSLHPATMLRDNLAMAMTIFEAVRLAKVPRMQFVSSACVYPRYCTLPTPETEGFLDDPEPTNYGYGWAKRMGEVLAKTYAQEYGMKISIVRPYNGYGPRDNFDPETSHVIPALVRRVISGEDPVVVWGSGTATRSFLFVSDFARGLMEAVERYPVPDPVNIGTEEEVSIKDLVALIIELSGSRAKIVFDKTRPDGQPRRNCNTKKAKEKIGFVARVPLREGLKRTIQWYKRSRE